MLFNLNESDWALAEKFFVENPRERKFIPLPTSCPHYFIKTDENEIFVLPRKRERNKDPKKYILGSGTYSLAVKAQNKSGQLFACKLFGPDIVIPDDESVLVMKALDLFKGQMTRRKKTAKKVVKKNNETITIDKKGYQLQPLIPGETLYKVLVDSMDKKRNPLLTLQKDLIALKACLALLSYHKRNIIHGDISLMNMMIHIDAQSGEVNVSLIDQGFSLLLPAGADGRKLFWARGSKEFMAPEIFKECFVSFQSDIYALGRVFHHLNRKDWADKMMANLPDDRASLHEIMLDIIRKIVRENNVIPPFPDQTLNFTRALLLTHFSEKLKVGIPLAFLIQQQIFNSFFNGSKKVILVLEMCKAVYTALKANPNIKIHSEQDFLVKKNNDEISVDFRPCPTKINPNILPEEYKTNHYFESSLVYSLAKISEILGCDMKDEATSLLPSDRPELLPFIKDILDFAEKSTEPEPSYNLALADLRAFFQIPSSPDSSSRSSSPGWDDEVEEEKEVDLNLEEFFGRFEKQIQFTQMPQLSLDRNNPKSAIQKISTKTRPSP